MVNASYGVGAKDNTRSTCTSTSTCASSRSPRSRSSSFQWLLTADVCQNAGYNNAQAVVAEPWIVGTRVVVGSQCLLICCWFVGRFDLVGRWQCS